MLFSLTTWSREALDAQLAWGGNLVLWSYRAGLTLFKSDGFGQHALSRAILGAGWWGLWSPWGCLILWRQRALVRAADALARMERQRRVQMAVAVVSLCSLVLTFWPAPLKPGLFQLWGGMIWLVWSWI